jgi:hypothetical protein
MHYYQSVDTLPFAQETSLQSLILEFNSGLKTFINTVYFILRLNVSGARIL